MRNFWAIIVKQKMDSNAFKMMHFS